MLSGVGFFQNDNWQKKQGAMQFFKKLCCVFRPFFCDKKKKTKTKTKIKTPKTTQNEPITQEFLAKFNFMWVGSLD